MRSDATHGPSEDAALSRRALLAHGASATGALVGLDHLAGEARAWQRFDVDFKAPGEVWLIVGDDLRYDPPAVAHLIVDRGGDLTCDLVEFTAATATTVPAQYGDAAVVKIDSSGTILGVLPYNRPIGDGGRFSRPRCVLGNDQLPVGVDWDASWEADCVQAASDDHWNGGRRECWFDALDSGGQQPVRTTIAPDSPPGGVAFGAAVELNAAGDVAVVGAPGVDGERGAAYTFERTASGWSQTGRFRPVNDVADFGSTVDIDAAGSVVIVGAPAVDEPATDGSASLFAKTDGSWERLARLAGDGDPEAEFGRAVSLDGPGETAAVGVPYGLRADERGRVVLFERLAGWQRVRTLFVPDLEEDLGFGGEAPDWGRTCHLDDAGDTLVVAATMIGFSFGEVRVFTRAADGWSHAGLLARGADSHSVGYAMDLTPGGGTCVLGSNVSSPDTPHATGFAQTLRETESPWAEHTSTRLTPADGQPLDGYGRAVATERSGEHVLVGAPYHDPGPGDESGAAYLVTVTEDAATQDAKLVADDGTAGDTFGEAVALDRAGNRGLIGAPGAEGGGAVYVLDPGE